MFTLCISYALPPMYILILAFSFLTSDMTVSELSRDPSGKYLLDPHTSVMYVMDRRPLSLTKDRHTLESVPFGRLMIKSVLYG